MLEVTIANLGINDLTNYFIKLFLLDFFYTLMCSFLIKLSTFTFYVSDSGIHHCQQ